MQLKQAHKAPPELVWNYDSITQVAKKGKNKLFRVKRLPMLLEADKKLSQILGLNFAN